MPRALFTPKSCDRDAVTAACPTAVLVSSTDGEDVYAMAGCDVTCRRRTEPGDFVSRQVLGYHNAIRTGALACPDRDAALAAVAATVSVVGIVGPGAAANEIAVALARHLSGVVVTESGAFVWAEPGVASNGGGR